MTAGILPRVSPMRVLLLALAAFLVPGACPAAEKLYLSRTFEFDFNAPGKITRIEGAGEKPVSEDVRKNSWVLILPKRLNLTLSIANDNDDEHHYHVAIHFKDEQAPAQKFDAMLVPTDLVKILWLDVYRVQVSLLRKDADAQGRFHTATVKIEVFVPEPKKRPAPVE